MEQAGLGFGQVLGVASLDYQVGAHFEALDKGVLVAASKSIETFFAISTFPELR